ncbi:hypothetical protein B7494_g3370 [Chlorociboria aeruginascens]|nr:hypothetical protein B7494_g3370 [Chlorociboria aeruginascens]
MAPSLAEGVLGSSAGEQAPDAFHRLVSGLSKILGPCSGLNSEDVDVQQLQTLMENYVSTESEWKKYAFADTSRGYTRNLVDEGNGKSNLLVLVWTPGKGSPVHDHADAHCLMKILKGTLKETRFDFPRNAKTAPAVIGETTYRENQVTYMADELGVHKISNPDQKELAVSLHLYTPPNAAKEGCNIFDERTGKRSHISQSNFFSEFGRKPYRLFALDIIPQSKFKSINSINSIDFPLIFPVLLITNPLPVHILNSFLTRKLSTPIIFNSDSSSTQFRIYKMESPEYPEYVLPPSIEDNALFDKTPAASSASSTKLASWMESQASGNTSTTNTSTIPSPTLPPKSPAREVKPTVLPAAEPSAPTAAALETQTSTLSTHTPLPGASASLPTVPKTGPPAAEGSEEARKTRKDEENQRWAERFDAAQPGGKGLSVRDQEYVSLMQVFAKKQEELERERERSRGNGAVATKGKKWKRFWFWRKPLIASEGQQELDRDMLKRSILGYGIMVP